MRTDVTSPSYATEGADVPLIDAVTVLDHGGETATVSVANRSLDGSAMVQLRGVDMGRLVSGALLSAPPAGDRFSGNTRDMPDNVVPQPLSAVHSDRGIQIELPPVSWGTLVISV